MPLTRRSNNTTTIIQASWWNDFLDLLSGVMNDQPVDLDTSVTLSLVSPPSSGPTLTINPTNGNKGVGTYQYRYSYVNSDGAETQMSPLSSITVSTTGSSSINVAIPSTAPSTSGQWSANIYRTTVNGAPLYFVANSALGVTYVDNIADGGLGNAPPDFASIGGVRFKDTTGTTQGYLSCAPDNQRLGIYGQGRVEFRNASGLQGYVDQFGIHITGGSSSGLSINTSQATTAWIQVGRGGLGIKRSDGVKIAEAKDNGNFIISGGQYQTTAGSVAFSTGQAFDSFDVAEVYPMDSDYAGGTVVCLADDDVLTRCTHPGCPYASVVTLDPGYLMGNISHDSPVALPIALSGSINVATSVTISRKQFVVSDGNGGVRPLASGEAGFALGFALNNSSSGLVGVFVRPSYVVGV